MASADDRAPHALDVPDLLAYGRDELNIAEFPISVLPYRQPLTRDGRKVDTVVYEANRRDPVTRQLIRQKVTLSAPSKIGLPTSGDELPILALICLSRATNDLADPRVHFAIHRILRMLGWEPKQRNYQRFATAILRYKAMTAVYENAWSFQPTDAGQKAGPRQFRPQFMTGVIAEANLAPSRTRLKPGQLPPSYVHWTPYFHQSLLNGNIKKLDLETLFSLRLPISQRLYRFLDKRFYTQAYVEMDLSDFAFGHIGLTPTPNVAEVKRRLAPAIAELESIGFIAAVGSPGRYTKIKKGVWRIRLEPGTRRPLAEERIATLPFAAPSPATAPATPSPAARLVAEFYRLWAPGTPVTEQAEARAADLIARYGEELVFSWLPKLVRRMKQEFPTAKTFQASLLFFPKLDQEHKDEQEKQQRLEAEKQKKRQQQAADKQRQAEEQAFAAAWQPAWDALPDADRDTIRATVLEAHPYLTAGGLRHTFHATYLCLQELARQRSPRPLGDLADSPQTVN